MTSAMLQPYLSVRANGVKGTSNAAEVLVEVVTLLEGMRYGLPRPISILKSSRARWTTNLKDLFVLLGVGVLQLLSG